MRKWINLLVEMSAPEARAVFLNLGTDPSTLTPEELKTKYRKLMMANHPDRGGDEEVAKSLSAAYDVLKNKPAQASDAASKPSPRPTKQSFENLDYVKEWFAEQTAGKPSQKWTVMNFDGHFFRNSFTVPANHDMFPDMARIMNIWDKDYKCRAVLVGTRSMLEKGTVAVIWCDGQNVTPIVTLDFDSMNLNPANDQSFGRELPRILDKIAAGEFVSQSMLD